MADPQDQEDSWPPSSSSSQHPLRLSEYRRYGRQMILPDFGLPAQLRIRNSRVLVVGAGGLGCPSVQYLAAAGVGSITILDHDVVEVSNLARQILHNDAKVGMNKARSIAEAVRSINPHVQVNSLEYALTSSNAVELISSHDLVLDCTDNPLTRYLISDAAVLAGVQVVSGAAQGYEGQLMVLHKKLSLEDGSASRGPCYRCLFPKAPLPEQVTNCEDGGVLGGITGLVGTMQAVEAIKILAQIGEETPPSMVLVSPMNLTPFRTIKLRPRRIASCRACGDPSQVGATDMIRDVDKEDYATFCGLSNDAEGGASVPSIAAKDLAEVLRDSDSSMQAVLDVRPRIETGISSLPGQYTNVPFTQVRRNPAGVWAAISESQGASLGSRAPSKVYVICRRGNDSRDAVRILQSHCGPSWSATEFLDVRGGLEAYARDVDPDFPVY